MRLILASLLLASPALAGLDPGDGFEPDVPDDADILPDAEALPAEAPPAAEPDTPRPLEGVPLDFTCASAPPAGHPIYRRYAGHDLTSLVRWDPDVDLPPDLKPRDALDPGLLRTWLDRSLCTMIWDVLSAAGAHAVPDDVQLPARAVLEIRLRDTTLEGSREVDQQIGNAVMPIAIPHWTLSLGWSALFSIQYRSAGDAMKATPLDLAPRGGAEQDDYSPLRLGALLRAATHAAFDPLPSLLADEGRLGDLLFAVVDRPSEAPAALGVSGTLSSSFWLLLSPIATARHDALAFYLSSDRVQEDAREQMARWFLLHDSDLGLRRDALGWLLSRESAPQDDLALTDRSVDLLFWLLTRDPSPRFRAEVAHALGGRQGPEVRELLLQASGDRDPRVSEVAVELLKRFPPATAAELESLDRTPRPPRLAPWTVAFDGRLPPPPGPLDDHLLRLAAAAGGPAAEQFTTRWLRSTPIDDDDLGWVHDAWLRLSASLDPEVRREAIARLAREQGRGGADEILATRVAAETDHALRQAAIEGLFEPATAAGATEALLQATHDDTPQVRAAAAERLAEVRGGEVQRRLEVLLQSDPDARVRRLARRSLRLRLAAER